VRASPKLRPGIWDALVVLAVVALAVGTAASVWWGGHGTGPVRAVVSVDGVQEGEFSLQDAATHTINANGYTLEICTADGEIWVEASDCPTQDCVHTGHIFRSGQSIVCLPARVIVALEGPADNSDGPDIVIG